MISYSISEDSPSLADGCGSSVCRGIRVPSAEFTGYCSRIEPRVHFQNCRCAALSNPWLRNKLRLRPRTSSLIAYARTTELSKSLDEQLIIMENYCRNHGYRISKVFVDNGMPSVGLQQALDSLNEAAGLIAIDANQFVAGSVDRFRDLRPFVHHFLCHTEKHLITVEEGIDTHSPAGQKNALELLNDWKGCFY